MADSKQAKEKGILKLEPRPRVLTPQGSGDRAPSSPQPSVDRLSVTWADPGAMATNLFQLPDQPSSASEVKFSTGDGSDDEDYSASLSAVLRQRRASVRRSRKGRPRRPSSPVAFDDHPRRRSSVFTTSSGDTAISMEEGQPLAVTQEQIFENIHLHKEVLGSVKQQPMGMRRKLKIVNQAKCYIKQHEGQLQERLAQSKSTRDIYARFTILLATKWQQLKREAANTSNLLIPWELRIKEIESHFGSVVASYFTFLRWLFWVNLVIAFILLVFVIIPEYLTANPLQDGERKIIMDWERRNSSNLLILWEFEGLLKFSPIFYGYYSNVERPEYRMPLAYFLTGLGVYIYSFVAILRKMAENSRMSKLSEKEDECIFSWKLFTGWDFMIGNTETAQNRIASVILGFKEALLEEAEKKKDLRNWRIITLRALVNVCVVLLLVVSAYAVVSVVSRSNEKSGSWWRENETTIVVTVISITFPVFFELLGFLEHYHPRKQLRLQLARIMLLNLLNLYSLIFALFSKIEGMSKDLDALKPTLSLNATTFPDSTFNQNEPLVMNLPLDCFEVSISCAPCNMPLTISTNESGISDETKIESSTIAIVFPTQMTVENSNNVRKELTAQNLMDNERMAHTVDTTTESSIDLIRRQMKIHQEILSKLNQSSSESSESNETDFSYYDDWTLEEATVGSTNGTKEDDYFSNDTTTGSTITFDDNADKNTETTTADYPDITYYETTTQDISDTTVINLPSAVYSETQDLYTTDKEYSSTINFDYSDTETYYNATDFEITTSAIAHINKNEVKKVCPNISFNCSVMCGDTNVTQVFEITNCTVVEQRCYRMQCRVIHIHANITKIDVVYEDEHKRRMYNLTPNTKTRLHKLCWETMFGQELVKLTMMDLVFVLLGTLFMDFFRALIVRYMNRCWCWDLEKKFPEYGDFKIAENILHLINNQGMVWMGMFFSPGLVVLNVFKLMIMMYLRSWAVMTCNVPHEVVFRVSKSNNFYLALLLTMLFLCVLPVGYSIVWVKPSWHCGPFSEYDRIYYILTSNIYQILPKSLNFALEYIASPAIVIPLLVLLILIIYYLTSLTNSLREANNDLKIQLRRERTEERRKMFQLADTRRRVGSSALDNTPFARWKRALPGLPLRSIDSDERKNSTCDVVTEPLRTTKKRGGGFFAKIVGMALDKKSDIEANQVNDNPSPSTNMDDETDTDFHETLPKEVLKIKDIKIIKQGDQKKKSYVEHKGKGKKSNEKNGSLRVKPERHDEHSDKKAVLQKQQKEKVESDDDKCSIPKVKPTDARKLPHKQTSQSSAKSKQSDSITSIIPVITISATESDDELLQHKKIESDSQKEIYDKSENSEFEYDKSGLDTDSPNRTKSQRECKDKKIKSKDTAGKASKSSSSDLKSLRRQSSVDSTHEIANKEKKADHKIYQHSL